MPWAGLSLGAGPTRRRLGYETIPITARRCDSRKIAAGHKIPILLRKNSEQLQAFTKRCSEVTASAYLGICAPLDSPIQSGGGLALIAGDSSLPPIWFARSYKVRFAPF
jgi:hypothetical protein